MPNPTDTYLMYAQIAADMAADEANSGRRSSLLQMAKAWRELADEGAPSVAQQQQQPQPNDEE
jgi:hypothetical protein